MVEGGERAGAGREEGACVGARWREGEEELHSEVQYLHRRDVEMFSGTCWT